MYARSRECPILVDLSYPTVIPVRCYQDFTDISYGIVIRNRFVVTCSWLRGNNNTRFDLFVQLVFAVIEIIRVMSKKLAR